MHPRIPHGLFPIVLLLLNFRGLPVWGQTPTSLRIVIVEGEGAINNVKQRVNREPIVQVEDEAHKPVAGASVIFFLPSQGPGGTFANGTNSLTTTTTSAQGQAVARGIHFNNQAGTMEIRVAASLAGQTASAIITQTNVLGSSSSGGPTGGMSRATKILIVAAIVGGGVALGVLATHRGGSTTATPTTTITPGTVTVGAPQ